MPTTNATVVAAALVARSFGAVHPRQVAVANFTSTALCPVTPPAPVTIGSGPIANALILWPVFVDALSPTLDIVTGGISNIITLPTTFGRFYWMSGDNVADSDGGVGGVGDALRVLQTALNTNSGGGTYSVSLTSDFFLKITCSVAFTLKFGTGPDTTPSFTLTYGFTTSDAVSSAVGGVQTVTSPLQPYGIWRPGKPFWTDSRPQKTVVAGYRETLEGQPRITSLVSPSVRAQREISFLRLDQSDTRIEYARSIFETGGVGTFEYAWLQSIAIGRPIRLYENETKVSLGSAYYWLSRARGFANPMQRAPISDNVQKWNVGPLRLVEV